MFSLALLLGACAARNTSVKGGQPQIVPDERIQEEPETSFGKAGIPVYRIGSADVLNIQVKGESECSGEFRVNAKGMIRFCYLGEIAVQGKTLSELNQEITQSLARDYIKDPRVLVEAKQLLVQSENIRVIGQVNRPGIYPLKSGYTVLDAILDAGGFTEFASPNRTRVVRGEGKSKVEIVVKLKDVMTSGDRQKDASLKPGDMIIVPEAMF